MDHVQQLPSQTPCVSPAKGLSAPVSFGPGSVVKTQIHVINVTELGSAAPPTFLIQWWSKQFSSLLLITHDFSYMLVSIFPRNRTAQKKACQIRQRSDRCDSYPLMVEA
jgi:hypothetical protein